MNNFVLVFWVLIGVIIFLLGYGVFTFYFDIIWGSRTSRTKRLPRYRTGQIVSNRMQVIRIRRTIDGDYEYKVRYYNSLIGGYWVSERDI